MREIKHYVAWDDTEFESVDECMAYEERAISCAKEISKAYYFYDNDMNMFYPPVKSDEVINWLNWIEEATEKCDYIKRLSNLTPEAEELYRTEWGFIVLNKDFNNDLGLFYWDCHKDKWIKVGE